MITLLAGLSLAGASDDGPIFVPTDDGAYIALHHVAGQPGDPPVVLCHGISSNHWFWDLEPDRSLAKWLSEHGYDVWNMDLRGHGDARRSETGRRQKAGWTVDDYGNYDLPAAFEYVQEHTGSKRIAYVGHSMGGMVLAVYLATHAETPLSAAITVGSPLDFRDADRATATALKVAPLAAMSPFVRTDTGARLLGWMDMAAPMDAESILYNPDNMTEAARRWMLRKVVSPLSSGEVRQFGKIRKEGEFVSADGTLHYRTMLQQVTVPMLFLAGRADRVVNPDRVKGFYDAVGSRDKQFFVASVANGLHGDYGHLDLGDGDYAAVDIFPRIGGWLDLHP